MSDLTKRLRGKYSVGPDGVYEDRDFGTFTPAVCREAATEIERLQSENSELKERIRGLHAQFDGWDEDEKKLRSENEQLRTDCHNLIFVGNQLSNVAFNLAQKSVTLTDDRRKALSQLRTAWDALRCYTPTEHKDTEKE